jgi:signal transduction histidine kinase
MGLTGSCLTQRSPARRGAGWALAVGGPLVVTLALFPFRSSLSLGGFFFCMLVVVLADAAIGGTRPALATVALGAVAGASFYDRRALTVGTDLVSLVAFLAVGAAVGILIGELGQLAGEQASSRRVEAALRRVATLVARAAPADAVFAAVTEEAGHLLRADRTTMTRYEPDGTVTFVAGWSSDGGALPVGQRPRLGGNNLSTIVSDTRRPARIDNLAHASGAIGAVIHGTGLRSGVAAPVIVQGRLWGIVTANSTKDQPLPPDTEARLASFTDLVATAISNAENLSELITSRARVVAAADETRRRIERDLHDGAQQRLISLGLALRAAQATVPPQLGQLEGELAQVAEGLASVHDDLREMAHGIHPAILARGLASALRTLARRSAVPVEVDVQTEARLPERVEVAAYYVVAEALTNAAKHAGASVVHVHADADTAGRTLRLRIRDDGAGGADPGRGSGLVGLKDRVEALGGTITIQSPAGAGTTLNVELPAYADRRRLTSSD